MSECADGDELFGPYTQVEAKAVMERLETFEGCDSDIHVRLINPKRATLDVERFFAEETERRKPYTPPQLVALRLILNNPDITSNDYWYSPMSSLNHAHEEHEIKIEIPELGVFCVIDKKYDRRDGTNT